MAAADPFTSNGTCYYSSGQRADPAYIPCGNAAFGTVPCCQAGDYCLSNNACFNNQYGNVYFAGCTSGDTYNNEAACPRKYTLADQQWVGMVRCFQSNDDSKQEEIWQGCHESIQPLNTIGDACKCTLNQVGGLYTKASPDLPREALLPTTVGGPITFASGYGPANTDVTATSKVNLTELTIAPPPATPLSGWSTIGSNATETGGSGVPYTGPPGASNTAAASSGGDGGLSTGAKAGIGVGAAIGGIALISILWCLFLLNRRLSRVPAQAPATPTPMGPASPAPGYDYSFPDPPETPGELLGNTPKTRPLQSAFAHPLELEGSLYHTAGSEVHGWKSELPGDNTGAYEAQLAHGSPSPGLSQFSTPVIGSPVGTSDDFPYSRDRGSVVSSMRGSDYTPTAYVSPQSTGEVPVGHHVRNGSQNMGGMDSIDEAR
ncbi:hypothetical protein GQ53DRAFT_812396 [Thozetella sp. PMI_491]|nr:hypothetical protein GQ53DRAFT_812396 [Thozetella sp. PMI_491]